MAPRPRHMQMVDVSKDEATLAVRLYNDPAEPRSFEGFVVHMHLAWLYLLQAELTRDDVDFRYRRRDNPRMLDRVDGEPKRWELARCVEHRWPQERQPVRANLVFFIGLRNRIEHRYVRQQQSLATALAGECQALLLNYEEELTGQFGAEASLATRLRFPVFVGSFTSAGEEALRKLRRQLPAALRTFIADYQADLDPETSADPRYEFRLRVVQELAPKDPDALAIQYTRFADMTAEEQAAVEALGRKGQVVVREQQRRVVGHDLKKPKQVVAAVAAEIPFEFGMGHFTQAWRALGVRPPTDAEHPERTDEKYCLYDVRHNDYGYTDAYIRKLIRECGTEEAFRALLNRAPKDKITGQWVGEPPLHPGFRKPATP